MIKKKDPEVFDYLDRYQIAFSIHPTLAKLLKMDADKATRYMLNRYSH